MVEIFRTRARLHERRKTVGISFAVAGNERSTTSDNRHICSGPTRKRHPVVAEDAQAGLGDWVCSHDQLEQLPSMLNRVESQPGCEAKLSALRKSNRCAAEAIIDCIETE